MKSPLARFRRHTLSHFESESASDAQLHHGVVYTSTGARLNWTSEGGSLLYLGGEEPLPSGTKFFRDVEREIHNQLKKAKAVTPPGRVVGDTKRIIQDLVLSTDTMTTMPYYVSEYSSENSWTPEAIEDNIQLQKSQGSERNSVVFLEGSSQYISMFLGIPGVDLTVVVADEDQLRELGIRGRTSSSDDGLAEMEAAVRDLKESSDRSSLSPHRSDTRGQHPVRVLGPDTSPSRDPRTADLRYEGESEDSNTVVEAEPQTEGYSEGISPTPVEPSSSGPMAEPSGAPTVDVPSTQAITPEVNMDTQPGTMDYDGSPDLT